MSVTVFIPNRNMADTLGAAIESACRQAPLEVVVIDDASTDGSLDVVAALAERYEMIRLVSRTEKSACWQEAAAEYYDSFSGKYVICLGADDELINGVVSLGSVGDFPLIFTDYLVRSSPGEEPYGIITQNVAKHGGEAAAILSPGEVQERFLSPCFPTETGIGSLIRRDLLMWLKERLYWRLGPWSDAVGYAALAAMYGAVYVPGAGAVFTQQANGYGATHRMRGLSHGYHSRSKSFLKDTGLPQNVCEAICRKRGIYA
jgi:glycosyltransferase involved in cell wall biosynthesis